MTNYIEMNIFLVENILKFPYISLIEKILQKNINLGPKLKIRLKYFKFQNEASVDKS